MQSAGGVTPKLSNVKRAVRDGLFPMQMLNSVDEATVVAVFRGFATIFSVNRLTKQEQLVLCIVLGLLLAGWAVKTYRAAHPTTVATRMAD
jgi:uncharacterized membrane protein (DUF4010 family)